MVRAEIQKQHIAVRGKTMQMVDRRSRTQTKSHSSLPDHYLSGDQTIAEIKGLASKGKCGVPFTAGWQDDTDHPGGQLFVVHVGNKEAPKRVMLVANAHAREAITAEVALRFLRWACSSSTEALDLFTGVRFTVLPVLNLGGRRRVDDGSNPCQRATVDEGEGEVDLNRNMDVDFEAGDGHGPRPFSTYQARILRRLAEAEQPLAYVDLHSGFQSLMVPWGSREYTSPDYSAQQHLLEEISAQTCPRCPIGSNCKVIGYRNPGEIMDHMYHTQRIKYSTLWEIYQGQGREDCLELFNPLEYNAFNSTLTQWTKALRATFVEIARRRFPTPRHDSSELLLTT
jgi:hypothetical protein